MRECNIPRNIYTFGSIILHQQAHASAFNLSLAYTNIQQVSIKKVDPRQDRIGLLRAIKDNYLFLSRAYYTKMYIYVKEKEIRFFLYIYIQGRYKANTICKIFVLFCFLTSIPMCVFEDSKPRCTTNDN